MKPAVTLPLLSLLAAAATANPHSQRDGHPRQLTPPPTRPPLSLSESASDADERDRDLRFDPLEALQHGLDVMQSEWFELWVGTWPTAIDWTAAVLDTHLVASLSTLSKALEARDGDVAQSRDVENDLNHYFSQNVRALPFRTTSQLLWTCDHGLGRESSCGRRWRIQTLPPCATPLSPHR